VMLPYTPLHTLLLGDAGGPVVATSGNRADEPICTDEREAVDRLGAIADLFLVHDRPIVRHVDDSVVRVVLDRELVLRRARGYAPLPVPIKQGPPLLAVGGHLKNTVALAAGGEVIVSQHIGDLESVEANAAFVQVIGDLQHLYGITPGAVIADRHPDYRSTRHAASLGLPVVQVQHHVAHVAGCMAENQLDGRALGVAWDGTGYGLDGTVWGGEFFAVDTTSFTRVACLRPFQLPGGDRAIKEPRRSALGALHAIARDNPAAVPPATAAAFTAAESLLLIDAMGRGVNAPVTTSAGRLFDAVASLAGLRQRSSFEGQAAMDLEFAIVPGIDDAYPFELTGLGHRLGLGTWQAPRLVIDWAPMMRAVVDDASRGVAAGIIAARAHNSMVGMIVAAAEAVNETAVVLSGGCFQNRYLLEHTVNRLRRAGFRPYWHQRVPPNDGGIALGQIAAYLRAKESPQCVSPSPDASSRSTVTTPCSAAAGSTSPAW
jgi:hydrogenase maturation protein HypF